MAKKVPLPETQRLLEIVRSLRKRCPWDRKQTHRSLVPYLVEEAFETIDAIETKNGRDLMEELGDVLLQVALHSEIAREAGRFTFEDIARAISDKMVRRHPHVYSGAKYRDYQTHLKNWTETKRREKPKRGRLDGLPTGMPALILARRYGEVASSIGFDWKDTRGVENKVLEEWHELRTEIRRGKKKRIAEELGDLLFTLSQLARHLDIDPEAALRFANAKFRRRFAKLEKVVTRFQESTMAPDSLQRSRKSGVTLKQMEEIWKEVKRS